MRLTTFCLVEVTRDERGAIIKRRMVTISNDLGIIDSMLNTLGSQDWKNLKSTDVIRYERCIYEAEAWTPERAN